MEGGKKKNFNHMKNNKRNKNRKSDNADVKLSKKLSYILRHGALEKGIALQPDGFVWLDELKKKGKVQASLEQIQKIVNGNDKKRFELEMEDNKWKIRAVQGHTIKQVDQELLLTRISKRFYYIFLTSKRIQNISKT